MNEKMIDEKALDLLFYEELDGDIDSYSELISALSDQVNELIDAAQDESSPASLAQICHKMKSSCQVFGFTQLLELVSTIEVEIRQNNNPAPKELVEKVLELAPACLEELNMCSDKYFRTQKTGS